MKKIIIAFVILLASFGVTNAQKTPAKTPVKTAKTVNKKSSGMKKDGTPDMRMKQNKDSVKVKRPAGPTKKDGTADMRYKANKKK